MDHLTDRSNVLKVSRPPVFIGLAPSPIAPLGLMSSHRSQQRLVEKNTQINRLNDYFQPPLYFSSRIGFSMQLSIIGLQFLNCFSSKQWAIDKKSYRAYSALIKLGLLIQYVSQIGYGLFLKV